MFWFVLLGVLSFFMQSQTAFAFKNFHAVFAPEKLNNLCHG